MYWEEKVQVRQSMKKLTSVPNDWLRSTTCAFRAQMNDGRLRRVDDFEQFLWIFVQMLLQERRAFWIKNFAMSLMHPKAKSRSFIIRLTTSRKNNAHKYDFILVENYEYRFGNPDTMVCIQPKYFFSKTDYDWNLWFLIVLIDSNGCQGSEGVETDDWWWQVSPLVARFFDETGAINEVNTNHCENYYHLK